MSRAIAVLRAASPILFLSLFTLTAHAQYRGAIQGVVTDPQGAVVSGATVTLTNSETGQVTKATTNDGGVYSINALPPSVYQMKVEKAGFKQKLLQNLQVIAEQANAVNVQLELGNAEETVTVTDSTPLMDTETATVSGTVTSQQIQTMPSFGRDVFQLAQLAPGVFGDGSRSNSGDTNALPGNAGPGGSGATAGVFATENGPQITAGGGRRELNNIQLDGVGITSVSWAGAAVITPNEDSVKEVKVVSNSYDAEDGRYPGAQIKIISQNGTNVYHGSAFFKADRPGLNAYTRRGLAGMFDPVRNNARFNDFGGSVGGPIIHNRLFGFFSYETIRNHGTTNVQDFFPTSQFYALAAPGSAAAKFGTFPGVTVHGGKLKQGGPSDPHSCTDIGLVENVNCITIPGQGLNVGRPLTSPLGSQDPAWKSPANPGTGGDGGGGANNLDPTTPDFAFYNVDGPSNDVNVQYNFRVDFNATSKDLLAFSMYYVPARNDAFNGAFIPMNLFHHKVVNEAETFLWNRAISPTLLNEVRVNAAGWRWKDLSNNPNGPWGLPTANFEELNAPTDSNNAPLTYGSNGHINGLGIGAPGTFDQWTYAAKDVLTKVHGSHTIKMGGEITRLEFVDLAPWNARPTYFFRNLWDFVNDAPAEEQATFNPLTGVPSDFRKDTRSNLYGFFVQDNYKVRSNLTLDLGLRWEYNGPISDKRNNLGVVVLGSGANALTGIRVRKGGNLYSPSKTDFGPQVGFAWSPSRFQTRLVLRGGFGIGYTGQEEATSLNGRNNPPFLSPAFNLTFCPNPPTCSQSQNQIVYGANTFPSDVHSFYGYAANPFGTANFDPTTNLPLPGPNFSPIDLTGFPSNWPDTKTYRYSIEGQYDLGHQWVATLGYQGTATRNLTRQYNLNLFLYATKGVAFNPVVPHVDWYDEGGRANFNALLAEVRHSFGHSFQFDTQYRWSRSKDTGSNNYANGDYEFTLNKDYGRSDYDATHVFKAFGIWSPTFFRGNRSWIEKIAGGWSVSGIVNAHSGFPYTVLYSNFCDAIYQGGCGGGGTSSLRPAAYLGSASSDHSNSAFLRAGGDFPNFNPSDQGAAYFTPPSFTAGPSFAAVVGGATPGPVPGPPGIPRNSFVGPHYFDVDATLSKSFGFPNMKLLGENARLEFRANFFNLFNNLNLFNIQGDLTNSHFGEPQQALGARTVEMQARFSF